MTKIEQDEILDSIKSNTANFILNRQTAIVSAFASGDFDKYEYLTRIDLALKPNSLNMVRFQYSPLGQALNRMLDKYDKNDEPRIPENAFNDDMLDKLKKVYDEITKAKDENNKIIDKLTEDAKTMSTQKFDEEIPNLEMIADLIAEKRRDRVDNLWRSLGASEREIFESRSMYARGDMVKRADTWANFIENNIKYVANEGAGTVGPNTKRKQKFDTAKKILYEALKDEDKLENRLFKQNLEYKDEEYARRSAGEVDARPRTIEESRFYSPITKDEINRLLNKGETPKITDRKLDASARPRTIEESRFYTPITKDEINRLLNKGETPKITDRKLDASARPKTVEESQYYTPITEDEINRLLNKSETHKITNRELNASVRPSTPLVAPAPIKKSQYFTPITKDEIDRILNKGKTPKIINRELNESAKRREIDPASQKLIDQIIRKDQAVARPKPI